jgi:branched-subunit amino acid permease
MKSIPLNQFGLTWIPFFAAGFIISCILAACIPDRIQEDGKKEI